MTEDEYQEVIVSRLNELTKDQLADLRRRAAFFMEHRERSGIENQDWVLAGIIEVLNDRGLGHTIPPGFRIRNNRSFAGYATQADRVMQTLSEAVPNMTVTERLGLGVLAARALADYITWSPLSLETMLRNISKIPEAVEIAFPGYIDSGMLPFILKSRRAG